MKRKIVAIPSSPRGGETRPSADAWISGAGPGRPVKRLTVEIDEALWRRLRIHAATHDTTMTAVVRRLLEKACPG